MVFIENHIYIYILRGMGIPILYIILSRETLIFRKLHLRPVIIYFNPTFIAYTTVTVLFGCFCQYHRHWNTCGKVVSHSGGNIQGIRIFTRRIKSTIRRRILKALQKSITYVFYSGIPTAQRSLRKIPHIRFYLLYSLRNFKFRSF